MPGLTLFAHTFRVAGVQRGPGWRAVPRVRKGGALGYTYRRRRTGPNWGVICSLVLVAGAGVFFVPQSLAPRAAPPPPPGGSAAAPVPAAAAPPAAAPAVARVAEADQLMAAGRWN